MKSVHDLLNKIMEVLKEVSLCKVVCLRVNELSLFLGQRLVKDFFLLNHRIRVHPFLMHPPQLLIVMQKSLDSLVGLEVSPIGIFEF